MNPSIIFTTPSEFDLRSLTIMGINAKPGSSSPIGYFGTGLKYAVAVLIREGCTLKFHTPETTLEVVLRDTTFRGKSFQELALHDVTNGTFTVLPFTTELGKNWSPLMAYRELVTNTRDEDGDVSEGHEFVPPTKGLTLVVSGEAIRKARAQHDKMFLDAPVVIETLPSVQICEPHHEGGLFYRGMKVLDLPLGSAEFTYNFTSGVSLTEDRLAQIYHLPSFLARAIWSTTNPRVIHEIIKGDGWEGKTDTSDLSAMSTALAEAVLEAYDNGKLIRQSLLSIAFDKLNRKPKRRTLAITGSREATLQEALTILSENNFSINPDRIKLLESAEFIGLADKSTGEIFLTTETFRKGLPCVVGTLYEEYLHHRHNLQDETRTMQNHIIDDFATLMVDLHLISKRLHRNAE